MDKPMSLADALDVAIAWMPSGTLYADANEAAAVLRKFREKGLPFFDAASNYFDFYGGLPETMLADSSYGESWGKAAVAFRAMTEEP